MTMFGTGFPKSWSTLRKLLWLQLLQAAQAVLETVTGTTPLTLSNAISHAIVSLTRYGLCEQRNLPKGYTETDMTINGSAAYIDTGVVPDVDDMEYDCVFYVPSSTNYSLYLLQARENSALPIRGISGSATGNTIFGSFSGTNIASSIARVKEHTYHANFKAKNGEGTLYVKDLTSGEEDTKTGTYTFAAITASTWLFGNSASAYLAAGHGVKSAYVKKAGVLQFNYTACKNSSNVAGFYDSVSNQFVGATSGDFTAGADSVPSPINSMAIWCNNGRIVAGNCISNIPDGQGTFVSPSEWTTTRIYKAFPTDLVVGRSYTVTVTGEDWTIIVQKKKPNDTDKTNVSGWVTTYAFAPEEGYIYGVAMQKTSGGSAVDITPADFNGTLTLDTTDGKPWAAGTPEVLTVSGNIIEFNETRIDNTTWASADKSHGFEVYADVYSKHVGDSLFSNGNTYGAFIPCAVGQSVSINFFDYAPVYARCYYCEVTADGKCNTEPVKYSSDTALAQQTFTLTQTDSIGFVIEWYISAEKRDYTKENYAVCYGTTPLAAYQPYTPIQTVNDVPMLLSVGDYKDEAEIIQGVKTGRIGYYVFDGTENWSASDWDPQFTWDTGNTLPAVYNAAQICTHFPSDEDVANFYNPKTGIYENYWGPEWGGTLYLYWPDLYPATAENVPLLKQWFAAQYAAGTPVILFFALYDDTYYTTEQTTAQHLVTHQGTNIVDSVANVGPVEAEVEYMASQSNAAPLLGMMGMVRPGAPGEPETPEEPTEENPVTE